MAAEDSNLNIKLFFRIYDCENKFWFCFYFSFNKKQKFEDISQSVSERVLHPNKAAELEYAEMYFLQNKEIVLIEKDDTPEIKNINDNTIIFFKCNYFRVSSREKPYTDPFKYYDPSWLFGVSLEVKKEFQKVVMEDVLNFKSKFLLKNEDVNTDLI